MRNYVALEKMLIENKPIRCEKCNGKLFYVHSGMYRCDRCGYEVYDDFGKVRKYLDENGPTPMPIVSQATGVSMEVLGILLRQGRVEIPDGSNFYISCEKCGCSIRYGHFCPACAKNLAGDVKGLLYADIGERPKKEGMNGKMRFLNDD